MSRQRLTSLENTFVQGLVTEATALSFPEHAATAIWDCVVDQKGVVTRRLGWSAETGATNVSRTIQTGAATSEFIWNPVAGDGSRQYLVQQIGSTLYFYNTSSSVSVSPNYASTTINLVSFEVSGTTKNSEDYACQYANGNGVLLVANPACEPFYVSYSAGAISSGTQISIRVRDFAGLDDGLDVDARPGYASLAALAAGNPNHYYNLFNQGWSGDGAADAIVQWDAARTDVPSNSDRVVFYRASETDSFDNARVAAYPTYKKTHAAKGHFILNPFAPNRDAAMLAEGVTVVTTGGSASTTERPSCVAFYTGRVWWTGVNATDLSTSIYFSRIIQDNSEFGKCYQQNDPTSEFTADLLPDDGGVITIPEMGQVKRLVSIQRSLLVIASNGVWLIGGSSGAGFKANDYTIQKLSSAAMDSPQSVVSIQGIPMWWAEDGIYRAEYDSSYDSYKIVNVTLPTIKSFFLSIPTVNRKYVKSAYDALNNVVYWVYNDTSSLASSAYYTYNKVLAMNGYTGAFYPWTITSFTTKVVGVIYVTDAQRTTTPVVKYPTLTAITDTTENLSYAETRLTNYLDWATTDYTSYLITGHKIHGDTQRFFQGNYLYTFMSIALNSSLYGQGLYEFTNSGNSGHWSTPQQVYKTRANADVSISRIKVRGKGRAMQLKYFSESGKPFTLLGWSVWESTNASI